MPTFVRVTPPAKSVISLEDAKDRINVQHTDKDSDIQLCIDAATAYLDGRDGVLGRAMITQTWRVDGFNFWDDTTRGDPLYYGAYGNQAVFGPQQLRLSPVPVASIVDVKYYDKDNVQQTLAPQTYQLLSDGLSSYVALAPGQTWPSVYWRRDAVTVTFVAGYGPNPSDVPASLRMAVCMMVGHHMQNTDAVIAGMRAVAIEVPLGVYALIAPLCVK